MSLVSVLMPMRNAEPYVEAAVRSVLEQECVDFELIVIDDGSTDSSRATVERFGDPRIRIVDGPRAGFAQSMNTGFAQARGEFVVECDADDIMAPSRLRMQHDWLLAHPEFGAMAGGVSTMAPDGEPVVSFAPHREKSLELTNELREGRVRTHFCTYMIRKKTLDVVGWFRPYFESSPDIDLQLRLGEQCRVGFLDANCYWYRIHPKSITHTQAEPRREFFEAMAFEFQRQRREPGRDALDRGEPPTPPEGDGPASDWRKQLEGQLVGQAWRYLDSGDGRSARRTAWRALCQGPTSTAAWRCYLLILLRSRCRRTSRPSRGTPG